MGAPYHFSIEGNNCWLSPDRTIYWEEQKALIVSDLHFGKTGHFRKAGIAVPQSVYKEDLQRLVSQLQHFQPKQLIVVGDMFHSIANKELDLFKRWRQDFPLIAIELVKGNHDILDENWYTQLGVKVNKEELIINNFLYRHQLNETISPPRENYVFSGHLHPGVRIRGMGKQSLCFPCFYFTPAFCVLPAFSHFTGIAIVEPAAGDRVFAIVNRSVIPF